MHRTTCNPRQNLLLFLLSMTLTTLFLNLLDKKGAQLQILKRERNSPQQSVNDAPANQIEYVALEAGSYVPKKMSVSQERDYYKLHDDQQRIPANYTGRVSRQGCYYFLDKGIPHLNKRILAPPDVLKRFKCAQRLPDAFIIGVKKSGTTTLGRYLDLHPQIALADAARIPYNKSQDQVVQYFLDSMPFVTHDEIILANYPGYYWTNRVWFFRLLQYLPMTPKCLVIMRDPASRALSDYDHMRVLSELIPKDQRVEHFSGDELKDTFQETVLKSDGNVNESLAFIQRGMYGKHLADFLRILGRENMLLLNGNTFSKDPLKILKRVETFFKIAQFYNLGNFVYKKHKRFYCARIKERPDVGCMGKHKGRHHKAIDEEIVMKLQDFYRPYNKQLEKIFQLTPEEFDWFLE